jgi:hypothetical protein
MIGMDAIVIGPPSGLAAAVARALRRRGVTVLQATPADVADADRVAWLLAEAGDPPLVLVCDEAPYAAALRLVGAGRTVLAVEERRLPATAVDRHPARTADGRALARAAQRSGGTGRAVRLGRAGRRWVEPGSHRPPLSAERAAAVVLRSCPAWTAPR